MAVTRSVRPARRLRLRRGWLYAAGELSMTAEDLAKWDIARSTVRSSRPTTGQAQETEVKLTSGEGHELRTRRVRPLEPAADHPHRRSRRLPLRQQCLPGSARGGGRADQQLEHRQRLHPRRPRPEGPPDPPRRQGSFAGWLKKRRRPRTARCSRRTGSTARPASPSRSCRAAASSRW
jgi:hypothetical protein